MNQLKIIYYLTVFLIVGIPLFLNTYSDDEFTVNKTSFFRLLILIILVVLCYYSAHFYSKLKDNGKRFKPYFILLVVYLGVVSLSTFWSNSPFLSFFGSQRQQGLLQHLFYILFLFIFLLVIKRKQLRGLLYWIVASSFLVSLFGLLEYFGIRPIWFAIYDQGIASTLGHPSFLGAYLVMVIPLTVACFFVTAQRIVKLFWLVMFSLQLSALLLTETRAAWAALVLSLLFMAVLGLVKAQKKLILAIVSSLFLAAALVSIFTGSTNRFFNAQEGSVASRLIWWNQAVEAVKERPLLGYGLETQEDVLMSKYHPLQAVYSYYGLRTDRAHNEILDQLLTIGILGTLVFFLFVVYLFKDGIRSFFQTHDNKKAIMILALLTGILAYFIQGMFSFSVTVLSVYFWLYTAMLIVLVKREGEKADKQDLSATR